MPAAGMSSRLAALLLITFSFSAASVSCRQLRCPGCRQLQAQDGVVYVANASDPAAAGITVPTVRLVDALRDPRVRTIILLTNYTAGGQFLSSLCGRAVPSMRHGSLTQPCFRPCAGSRGQERVLTHSVCWPCFAHPLSCS